MNSNTRMNSKDNKNLNSLAHIPDPQQRYWTPACDSKGPNKIADNVALVDAVGRMQGDYSRQQLGKVLGDKQAGEMVACFFVFKS